MSKKNRLPEIIIFAGSKRQWENYYNSYGQNYWSLTNADDIKRSSLCSDLEAAVKAEELREEMIEKGEDFT